MKDFQSLKQKAKQLPLRKIAVANPLDKATLEALKMANETFPLKSFLIGNKDEIEAFIAENNIELLNYEIFNIKEENEIAAKAVSLIKNKEADILMKGLISTNEILKAVVNRETGIRTNKLLSHVAVFSYPNYHKLLFVSDCAMIIEPTFEQKVNIVENIVSLMKKLDFKQPKIAAISAVEKVNPKMKSSVEAHNLQEHFKTLEFLVEGPFAVDNIVSLKSRQLKGINSLVANDADALVFPNIDAGNAFYKTSVYLANATVAGVVLGALSPIVLTSRADDLSTKYYSILLAGVYSYDS